MSISSFEFEDDVKKGMVKVFEAFEVAIGTIDRMCVEYDSWDDEITADSIQIDRLGESQPVAYFNKPINEHLIDKADLLLTDVLNKARDQWPSQDETTSASGAITITHKGNEIKVKWEHSDKYEEGEPVSVGLSSEDWEQMKDYVQQLGATELIIEYRGGGDSMDGEDYTFTGKNGQTVKVDETSAAFKGIGQIFDSLMNGEVSGFWNNEGGYGQIKITADEDNSYWEHFDNIEKSDEYQTDFIDLIITGQEIPEGDLIEAVVDPVWG